MKTSFLNLKGLLALAITTIFVIGMSAFSSAENQSIKRARYSFYYNGPSTADKAQVENIANWATTPPLSCNSANERPCTIEVEDTYVNPGSTPTLKSNLNLVASQAVSHDTYYVLSSDDESMEIANQSF